MGATSPVPRPARSFALGFGMPGGCHLAPTGVRSPGCWYRHNVGVSGQLGQGLSWQEWESEVRERLGAEFQFNDAQREAQLDAIGRTLRLGCSMRDGQPVDLENVDRTLRSQIERGEADSYGALFQYSIFEQFNDMTSYRQALC